MRKPLIYRQEITDGVAELIAGLASASYLTPVTMDTSGTTLSDKVRKAIAQKANPDQPDLHYLSSILATAGWNKNDQVFLPEELWAARHSPEDKPFNYQHDAKDIIGHITEVEPIDDEGKAIAEDIATDDLPNHYHLKTGAVLYKPLSDKAAMERIDQVIKEIAEKKWFISMELLFWDFDYALLDADKATASIVKRSKETAFLSKHLRVLKGDGEYEGKKVGQVFRSFVFSGKALVRQPGNAESEILSAHSCLWEKSSENPKNLGYSPPSKSIAVTVQTEKTMSNPTVPPDEMATLKAEVSRLTAALADAKGQHFEKTIAELKAGNETLTARASELETANKALNDQIKSLAEKATAATTQVEAEIKAKNDQITALQTEVNTFKQEKVLTDRVSLAMSKLNITVDEAKTLVAPILVLDDAAFEGVLTAQAAMMAKKIPQAAPSVAAPMGGAPTLIKTMPAPAGKGMAAANQAVAAVLDGGLVTAPQPALATVAVSEGVQKFQSDVADYYAKADKKNNQE